VLVLYLSIAHSPQYPSTFISLTWSRTCTDNQDQTINRLLRAQTSKSRSKLDAPQTDSPAPEPNQEGVESEEIPEQGQGGRKVMPIKEGMVRYVSRLEGEGEGGKLVNLIGVVEGREDWIKVG
jgi:Ino eighty subunit 2